jgi:hypothetical protein
MGSTGLAQDQADKSIPTQHPHARASSAWAAIIAWVVVIFASDLELVVAQAIGVNLPAWESLGRAAVLVLVALAIWRSRRLPYLHGLVLALAAFLAGEWLRWRIEANVVWFQTAARAYAMLGRVVLTLIPAALMALTVIASGLSRRDLFLTRGDMHAPANLPFLRRTRWSVVAPVLLLIMCAIVAGVSRFRPFSHHRSADGITGCRPLRNRQCELRGISFSLRPAGSWTAFGGCGTLCRGHIASVRARSLRRTPLGCHRNGDECLLCMGSCQKHARHARLGLGLVDSLHPGRDHLLDGADDRSVTLATKRGGSTAHMPSRKL